MQQLRGNRFTAQLLRSQAPIQRNDWKNEHNKGRLTTAHSEMAGGKQAQLDHSVSQNQLKDLYETLKKIETLIQPSATLYEKTKTAFETLKTHLGVLSKTGLLNLPNNLTPGPKDRVADQGDTFDPQVAVAGNVVSRSARTPALEAIDNAARALVRLQTILPNQSQGMKEESYNEDFDGRVAELLDMIEKNLTSMEEGAEPKLNLNAWYQNAAGDKYVKKVPATWLDAAPADLGTAKQAYPANLAESEFEWTYDLKGYRKNGNEIETYDSTVTVMVNIPVEQWKHIYDRHTVRGFAGDVKAINTFWRDDPFTTVTQELLKPELELLIDRLSNLPDSPEEYVPLNAAARKLFFQGSMTQTKDENSDDVTVSIELDSIAPQDPALALALRPDQFPAPAPADADADAE
ncbi:hypothetical protein EL26_04950 [Tumebacillus flagellatus]|uniref:Uncharacterized protein n=2 Tax=Tumebacillus flagellatus TaxID=1157490 RepID=A0A074LTL8_9BACL|nr:hypothetical protein EL26_04950 [Tumebacillus flagellatus]